MGHPNYRFKCPACAGRAVVRTSREVTPNYRQMTLACAEDPAACGWTGGAEMTITHTINQGVIANPLVALRVVPPRHRLIAPQLPANDGAAPVAVPLPANDQGDAMTSTG